jgi:nitrogen fixation/metabolism regulation signal transduction histidine kinase/anti-anti-sigma regulatory factor
MWQNLNLRTRILLGFGLVLLLAAALVSFLVLRVADLSSQIKQLNTSATFEATTGARVAAQVAASQRLVERYISQPQEDNLQSAQFSLQELSTEVERARSTLAESAQRQRLGELEQRLAAFLTTFQSLHLLIEDQKPLYASLNTHLTRSKVLLKGALTGSLNSGAAQEDITALIDAQSYLQQANLWAARLVGEQSAALGANALADLESARGLLTSYPGAQASAASISIANTRNEIAQAADDVAQLRRNLEQSRQQRDTRLDEQGKVLKQQADAIAEAALESLTTATAALERQTVQIQEITIAAVLFTFLLAVATALQLARTLAQPLNELVEAARRLNQGDYDVAVAQRDKSEIGLLMAAFNQIIATLRSQRDELQRQQAISVQHSRLLEEARERAEAATAERAALATKVGELSTPVVVIAEGVMLVPLEGQLDEQRTQLARRRLLDGIADHRARIVILDVTSVPAVNGTLALWLLETADAVALQGARCVLAGIGPEADQTLMAGRADRERLMIFANLRGAVEYAMRETSEA